MGEIAFLRVEVVSKPALPSTGQSALWKYKVIYINHNKENGQMSDEMALSV